MPAQPVPRSAAAGVVWPAVPDRVAASALALQFQFDRSQWWTPPQIAEWQAAQLGALLDHAIDQVPYYRERLGRKPRVATAAACACLAPLTPAEVRANAPALRAVSVPQAHGPLHAPSSGTQHHPTTDLVRFFQAGVALREHRWHGRDWSRSCAVVSDLAEDAGLAWGPAVDVVWQAAPVVRIPARDPLAALQRLAQAAPAYLVGRPRVLHTLAAAILAGAPPLPAMAEIRAVGEPFGEAARAACASAFGAAPTHRYEVPGIGCVALPCPRGGGWHVQDETVRAEVVDAQGRACVPGQLGRLLLTPLHAFAMPLIRYAPGELAEPGPPCECGRGLTRLVRLVAASPGGGG